MTALASGRPAAAALTADLTARMTQLAAEVAQPSRDAAEVLGDALACVALALTASSGPVSVVPEPSAWPGDVTAAGLSLVRAGSKTRRAATLAATCDAARTLDTVQLRDGESPFATAVESDAAVVDQLADPPATVLVLPLTSVGQPGIVLCVYREAGTSFSPADRQTVDLGAVGVGMVLSALAHRSRADNLDIALQSSRRIGAAIGVLMARQHWTYEQAFDALRSVSQRDQRKLRDIADEVVLTGTLVA